MFKGSPQNPRTLTPPLNNDNSTVWGTTPLLTLALFGSATIRKVSILFSRIKAFLSAPFPVSTSYSPCRQSNVSLVMCTRLHKSQKEDLRSKVCFDDPSPLPYVFVRRIVNKIQIVNTMLTNIKVFAYLQ